VYGDRDGDVVWLWARYIKIRGLFTTAIQISIHPSNYLSTCHLHSNYTSIKQRCNNITDPPVDVLQVCYSHFWRMEQPSMHHEDRSVDDSEERKVRENLLEHVEHHRIIFVAHFWFETIHTINCKIFVIA